MADKNQRAAHTLMQANRRFPRKNTEEGLTLVVVLGVGIALWTFALWGPLPAVVITALWYTMAYHTWRGNHRHRKGENRRAQQTHIAQLEAELGLPVLMVGECWNCRKPLAAGAKYCTYCGKTAEQPTAKVCAACRTRNPLDGVYCSECGKRLPEMA